MEWSAFELHLRHLPEREHKCVHKAYDMARSLHEGQKRKSGEPYFMHPVAVAEKLARVGADAETIIAALLHDTVEDTDITLDEIEKEFGESVTHLINGVTKLSASDIGSAPNLNEQTESLRKIFQLMQEDPRMMVIKLFDRQHNMETVKFLSPEKQKALAKETFDTYAKIADRLSMQGVRYSLEEMCYKVLDEHLYKRMLEQRKKNEVLGEKLFEKMRDALIEANPWFEKEIFMEMEKKSWGKLRAQLDVEGSAVSGLSPVTISFICPDRESCYRVMGALHKPWRREDLSFQDFINSPEINGYRGLHTTVILEDGVRVRCKIRTEEMQRYAHEGITLYCFDKAKRADLERLLPWTKRIQTLTEDTTHRSDVFWQSLQNDILGESIVIHGPDDRAVQLPKGATALDGAFYLFGNVALRTKAIRINGKEVPFHAPLKRADALDISFDAKGVQTREWLRWVTTSVATGIIRSRLTQASSSDRSATGREILNAFLSQEQKGFVEEYNADMLDRRSQEFGYATFDELLVGIADKKVEPQEVLSIFSQRSNGGERRHTFVVQYLLPRENRRLLEESRNVRDQFAQHIRETRVIRVKEGIDMLMITASLTSTERATLQEKLETIGLTDIEIMEKRRKTIPLLLSVVLLWALNPIVAKWFLLYGTTPMTLIELRLLTFCAFSIVVFLGWSLMHKQQYNAVPNMFARALLPAIGLTGMSVFNYFSLEFLAPSLHLTVLRLNTLLLPLIIAKPGMQERTKMRQLLLFFACVGPLLALSFAPNGPEWNGMVYALLALLSYTLYSVSTERVLKQTKISARYPLLQLYMGLFMGIMGFLLVWVNGLQAGLNAWTFAIVGYVIICVCIPHLCYALLLKNIKFKHVTDLFLLEVPLAVVFETTVLMGTLPLAHYVAIGFVLLVLMYSRWTQLSLHMTR